MSFSLLLLATSFVVAQSEHLHLLAHFNKYSIGYNDCWGYTDQGGREYALLGVKNGTSIIDITDTDHLREVNFIPSRNSIWKDIKTYQHYAYVVNETGGGLQIIDLSGLPEKAVLANTYKGFSTSHNIYIDEANALLYAEGTHGRVVRVLSLKDPLNPVEVSHFGVECHDIYARDNIAYVSEGGHGSIGVYDLSVNEKPELIGRFQIPNSGYVHNAWLSEDGHYLMTTEETEDKTVKMWDIRDLTEVRLMGEYLAPDALAHNVHVEGNYAYIAHYGSGLRVIDIRNPEEITEVGWLEARSKSRGFVGAWGTYPHFKSNKILMSDIEDGLYVVEHRRGY